MELEASASVFLHCDTVYSYLLSILIWIPAKVPLFEVEVEILLEISSLIKYNSRRATELISSKNFPYFTKPIPLLNHVLFTSRACSVATKVLRVRENFQSVEDLLKDVSPSLSRFSEITLTNTTKEIWIRFVEAAAFIFHSASPTLRCRYPREEDSLMSGSSVCAPEYLSSYA